MSDEQKASSSIDELLKQAIDKTNGEITYANTFGLSVSENEVILEFYFTLPSLAHRGTNPPSLLQRVVVPLRLGSQLAQMLSSGIAQVESGIQSEATLKDLD